MEIVIGTLLLAIGMFVGQNVLENPGMTDENNHLKNEIVELKSNNQALTDKLNKKIAQKKVTKVVPKIDGIEIAYLGD